MPSRRPILLLLCGFFVLLSAVTALVVRQAQGSDVDSTLWMNALLLLLGIMMLARASLGPQAEVVTDRCLRCGARTFETARSLDRRRVRTCFSCGGEDLASRTDANVSSGPESKLDPAVYPEPLPAAKKQ